MYFGDFKLDSRVRIPFNTINKMGVSSTPIMTLDNVKLTRDSDPFSPQVLTGVFLYTNFGGAVGKHLLEIHIPSVQVPDFMQAGSDYFVALSNIIIDGQKQNIFIGSFSIENRYNSVVANDLSAKVNATLDLVQKIADGGTLSFAQ